MGAVVVVWAAFAAVTSETASTVVKSSAVGAAVSRRGRLCRQQILRLAGARRTGSASTGRAGSAFAWRAGYASAGRAGSASVGRASLSSHSDKKDAASLHARLDPSKSR